MDYNTTHVIYIIRICMICIYTYVYIMHAYMIKYICLYIVRGGITHKAYLYIFILHTYAYIYHTFSIS